MNATTEVGRPPNGRAMASQGRASSGYKVGRDQPARMQVTITLYGPAREVVGETTVRREAAADATVRDVFESLQADHPDLLGALLTEDGDLASGIAVTRNETAIERDQGLDTPLDDGDELRVAHSLRGG